jgi:catechol 2,3-dioxygenase-like lactoylglutathione lyase family enzyme
MQLDGVMLFVAELEPMVAFYRDVIGFRPNDATRTEDWVEFDTGNARFALHHIPRHAGVKPSAAPREMSSCKPIVTVDDLASARTRLAHAGVTMLDRPWGSWDFVDPEGNVLGVREKPQATQVDHDRSVFESLSAIFSARDLPEALAFYTDVLGFDIGWTWGDPPSYASVCRDGIELNLGPPREGETLAPSSVYIVVTEIDAYYARLQARGIVALVEIGDRPYGMRDFTVDDPSGNKLSFGQATTG